MKQLEAWPPPLSWTECVVTWKTMLAYADYAPNDIMIWLTQYPSKYRFHLHGWQSTEGFAFRFEDQQDAIMFKLRWSQS
jgi:hypothetical protein